MATKRTLPVVEIEWEDAFAASKERTFADWDEHVSSQPCLRRSVGYLVSDTKKRIAILQTIEEESGDDVIVIPQSLVRFRHTLVEAD